jgi:HAD superfamily hydrolase (TIGR01509 family)
MKFQAVLFDYDGVTADTSRLNYQAWRHAFAEEGVSVSATEYYLMEGRSALEIAETLCRKHGINPERAAHIKQIKESQMHGLANSSSIYPEIPALLEALMARGIPMGLVTGASRSRLELFLPANIRTFYKVIITSEDVTHTKPHPEPYTRAAEGLDVPAAMTLVVENAPLGIASAKAGGFPCAALTTTLPETELRQADYVLADHSALFALLIS